MPTQVNVVRPRTQKTWQVWAMTAGNRRQPYVSRLRTVEVNPIIAIEKAMDAIDQYDDTTYVYVYLWPNDGRLPFVVFDSLMGGRVQGNPLPAVRRLLRAA